MTMEQATCNRMPKNNIRYGVSNYMGNDNSAHETNLNVSALEIDQFIGTAW
jgi:hypothetical protein